WARRSSSRPGARARASSSSASPTTATSSRCSRGSAEIFSSTTANREMKEATSENWTEVAKAADVPDEGTLPVTFEGEPVCLYKVAGEIYATHDICTHGHANLSDGFVVEGCLIE